MSPSRSLNEDIQQHYARSDLGTAILAALVDAGKDVNHLKPEDLALSTSFTSAAARRHSNSYVLWASIQRSRSLMSVAASEDHRAASPGTSDVESPASISLTSTAG